MLFTFAYFFNHFKKYLSLYKACCLSLLLLFLINNLFISL